MVKKILYILLFISSLATSAQDIDVVEETETTYGFNDKSQIEKQRKFTTDLKEKYSGRDFQYKEEIEKEKEKKPKTEEKVKQDPKPVPNNGFINFFVYFMTQIFPFLLGAIVIFIILKLYLGSPSDLWNSKNTIKRTPAKLVYEDEDIDKADLDGLLQRALNDNNTRLAIRYYYLIGLRNLSQKEIIKYDKDKTNSEYLFEIKDKTIRKEFSYLSYIYSYVWYGEFELNDIDFAKVKTRYSSFLKNN